MRKWFVLPKNNQEEVKCFTFSFFLCLWSWVSPTILLIHYLRGMRAKCQESWQPVLYDNSSILVHTVAAGKRSFLEEIEKFGTFKPWVETQVGKGNLWLVSLRFGSISISVTDPSSPHYNRHRAALLFQLLSQSPFLIHLPVSNAPPRSRSPCVLCTDKTHPVRRCRFHLNV